MINSISLDTSYSLRIPLLFFKKLFFFSLVFSSTAVGSYELTVLDEHTVHNLIPAQFMNHQGFELIDEPFQEFGSPDQILPMFPMYKQKFGGKKFIGVKIPRKYFTTTSAPSSSHLLITSPQMMAKINGISGADYSEIEQQMRHFQVEENVHLKPLFYQGDLYGVRSDYSIRMENSTSIGISFSFGGNDKTISLGEITRFGLHFDVGLPPVYLGEVNDYNLASGFNDLLTGIDLALHGDNSMDVIETTLKLTPYLQTEWLNNFDEPKGVNVFGRLLEARQRRFVELKHEMSLRQLERVDDFFSDEYRSLSKDLTKNLEGEVNWQNKIKLTADMTYIYGDPEANELIQTLCDHLANAYSLPQEIWPRCRISASMVPNAWAYPGGDIFITAGLIGILSDVQSLMYVIGHEIGHVFARHTSKMLPKYDAYSFAVSGLGIANSIFSMTGGMGELGSVTYLNYFYKVQVANLATSFPMRVISLTAASGLMHFSRENERQADRLGHQTSLLGGASPEAIKNGWQDFNDYFTKYIPKTSSWIDKLLASHPSGTERLKKIEKRNKSYHKKHLDFSQNGVSTDVVKSYSELHKIMSEMTHFYGEHLKKEIEKSNRNFSLLPKTEQLYLTSFASSASQCVLETFLLDDTRF